MKNKWIWITLSVILLLGLIVGAGVLGYQMGLRNANVLALKGDESTPYPRQLMPGMRDGLIVRRPTGFIGYFFLFPLGLLLRLAILVLVVWLVVKVAKAAWNGGNHKPEPAETTVSPAGSETVITEEAKSPSTSPSEAPQGSEK